MFLNVLGIFFTSALFCSAAPTSEKGIRQTCGAPPVVQNGDITDLKRLSYPTGSSVKYKCANYYKMEGKETITCRDGEWEKEPICRVPCTVREIDMQQNNIQFKYSEKRKLYSEHFNYMTFACMTGYKISDEKRLRIQCLDGVLKFPKCQKEGDSCDTPPVIQYGDLLDIKSLSYPSGSSVKYKCANYFKIEGKETITCRDGEWEKEPICRVPCTVREIDMQQNNIQFKHNENRKLYSEHFDYMTFACITGYKISDEKHLRIQCLDGVLKFPKCLKEGYKVSNTHRMGSSDIILKRHSFTHSVGKYLEAFGRSHRGD